MSGSWITRWPLDRALVHGLGAGRAGEIVADVAPHLAAGQRILDVGAGSCLVAARLRARGLDVTAADVHDASCEPSVVPILIDGVSLPFDDDAFDVALLITVLHHTHDPDRVLAEASRVARRLVVQEDVHRTRRQKLATMAMDSVVNLEFVGHPHSNRSDDEWRASFAALELDVSFASFKRFWRVFESATYVLERRRA